MNSIFVLLTLVCAVQVVQIIFPLKENERRYNRMRSRFLTKRKREG